MQDKPKLTENQHTTMNNKEIDEMLKFDSLREAEKITGESYKDSEATSALGMLINMQHGQAKREALESLGDSTLMNQLDTYQKIIKSIGFVKVLELPFVSGEVDEKFFVYFHHSKGILLRFDTYQGVNVNGGDFYYNWQPKGESEKWFKATSSGHFDTVDQTLSREEKDKVFDKGWDDTIWIGHHDCREAIKFNISRLEENGEFFPNWVDQPFIWLLHHGDTKTKDYDYEAINAERILLLPEDVQKAIKGQE